MRDSHATPSPHQGRRKAEGGQKGARGTSVGSSAGERGRVGVIRLGNGRKREFRDGTRKGLAIGRKKTNKSSSTKKKPKVTQSERLTTIPSGVREMRRTKSTCLKEKKG